MKSIGRFEKFELPVNPFTKARPRESTCSGSALLKFSAAKISLGIIAIVFHLLSVLRLDPLSGPSGRRFLRLYIHTSGNNEKWAVENPDIGRPHRHICK